jgi:hypothetical protein
MSSCVSPRRDTVSLSSVESVPHSHPPTFRASEHSCLEVSNMTIRHTLSLLYYFNLHPSPHILFPLLRCWITADVLARSCAQDNVHSILLLTLPATIFEPVITQSLSPSASFYAIPSLPAPLRYRFDPSLIPPTIRSQSPGSVRLLTCFLSFILIQSEHPPLPSSGPSVVLFTPPPPSHPALHAQCIRLSFISPLPCYLLFSLRIVICSVCPRCDVCANTVPSANMLTICCVHLPGSILFYFRFPFL